MSSPQLFLLPLSPHPPPHPIPLPKERTILIEIASYKCPVLENGECMHGSLVGDKICPLQTTIRSGREKEDGPRHDWHGHGQTYNHGFRHIASGEVEGGSLLYCTFVQERVSPLPFLYQITGDLLMKKPEPTFWLGSRALPNAKTPRNKKM